MRRKRFWLLLLASVVSAVAVAVVVALVGLPALVKWVAIHQVRGQLGRDATIERVRLDLWNGWYNVKGFRVAGRPGEPPLLEVAEIDLRIIYKYLFSGQIRAREIAITSPVLRLARLGPDELSISDIIERQTRAEKKPTAGEEDALEILADLILVSNGTVLFDDRAVAPPRAFAMRELTINVRDVSTRRDSGKGTGTIAFVLNGTPVAVVARDIRIRPAHLTAQLNVVDFDVDEVWAYTPRGAVQPAGGRFSSSLDLVYDAASGVEIDVETTIANFRLMREGQTEPLLSMPALKLGLRDLRAREGAVSLGRLQIDTSTSIVDASVSPARRYDITGLRLVLDNVAYPSGPPAGIQLSTELPGGATLEVRGTGTPAPLSANFTVDLAHADLALLNPYISPDSPITVDRGRVGAALAVAVSEGPVVRVDGDITAGYFLRLRGQAPPFIEHPKIALKIANLAWQGGAATMERLTADGPATIVDASVTPPERAHFTVLNLQADDITLPVTRPVRVRSVAVLGPSGSSTFEGTFNPATLAADIRARFTDLDVTRARPYIPATAPVEITGGRLGATVALKNDRVAGLAIDADGAVAGLGIALRGEPPIAITDQRLAFAVDGVRVKDDTLAIRRARVTGAPAMRDESVSPARAIDLRRLQVGARDLTWPARGPVPLELAVDLPEAGTLAVAGTADLASQAVDLTIDLKDAALSPYRAFLPMDVPLAGVAGAALTASLRLAGDLTVTGAGRTDLRDLTLGPPDQPAVAIRRVETRGVEVRWPGEIRVDLVKVTEPAVLLERDADGRFPLREMLTPTKPATAARTEAPSTAPSPAQTAAAPKANQPAVTVAVREVRIEEGNFRFVDRSTVPDYSEEISRLALTVTNLSSAPGARSTLDLQAVVGATGALRLAGEVAPTADPFYLDVRGELREMPLPRSNPYFRQVFDWFLKRGSVTNKIHYRIVGNQLTAENDVVIQRLNVEKDPTPVASDRKIGVPLGLIVAMITDRRGDIAFSLPVSGNLTEPGFSVGGAIWAALKNVLTNVVTAPFQAIGKLFGKDGEVEAFKVDPLTFPPGSAAVTAEGHQHLQRVADFLRASPNVHLDLRPVVSAGDLASLRTAEVTAGIQRVQREQKLASFDAAAQKLYTETFPGQPLPDSTDAIVERLRERATVPDDASLALATRRLESARGALVKAGGVEPDRLTAAGPVAGAEGQGRIEFDLRPGG